MTNVDKVYLEVVLEKIREIRNKENKSIIRNKLNIACDSLDLIICLVNQDTRTILWTCCGGIELHEDESCPICGDEY